MIRTVPSIRLLMRRVRLRRRLLSPLTGTVLTGIGIQVTLVVTGVVVARALGPENRGHFALLILVAAILWNLGPFGVPAALTYTLARTPGRAVDIIARLTKTAVIQTILAAGAAALLLIALTDSRPGYVQTGALITVLAVPAVIVQAYGLSVLSGLRRFTPFNFYRIAPNAAFAVTATALLLMNRAGFIELAVAWGLSRMVLAPFTLRSARRYAKASQTGAGEIPSKAWMLRFGRRAFLGTGSLVDTYRIDQSAVALFLSPAALGLYVVALAFTNLPRFIANSVTAVASPTVASEETREHARRRMWRFFWIAIPLYLPVVAGLWLFVPQLTTFFFGDEFAESAPITRLLLIATAIYCARRVLAGGARGAGYPGLGSIAEAVALVSALPLFAVFAPLWGINGVAYGLIASSALAFCALLAGLLRPSARRATAGSSWFETGASQEARDDTALGRYRNPLGDRRESTRGAVGPSRRPKIRRESRPRLRSRSLGHNLTIDRVDALHVTLWRMYAADAPQARQRKSVP